MTTTPTEPDFSHPLRVSHATLAEAAPERLATVGGPMTRSEVDVPLAPTTTPADTQLFVHPTDRSQRFWLPRYRIAQERVSGKDRYRIAFSETDGGWRLSLRLETRPAPGLENVANRFEMLDHELEVQFSYTVQGAGSSKKTLDFQEILRDQTGAEAALQFHGLPQRDEVFAVLADAARSPLLIVRRRIRVAVPDQTESLRVEAGANLALTSRNRVLQPRVLRPDPRIVRPIRPVRPDRGEPLRPTGERQLALPNPVIKFLESVRENIRGNEIFRHYLGVNNWREYDRSLFDKAPDLPPCGNNTNASRTWVDILDGQSGNRLYGYCAFNSNNNLKKFWVATKVADPNPPRSVRVRLNDRKTSRKVTSNAVRLRSVTPPPPPEPKFLIIEADMKQAVEPTPFAFSRDLHGYIFEGVGGSGGTAGGLVRHREIFDGIVHSYFQDAVERNIFYYIADEFRIARRGGTFRSPFMTLRVRSNGGSTQNTNVTWDYAVMPYTDPARLEAGRSRLAAVTSQNADAIEFQPYVTAEVTFIIQRPTETGRVSEERPSNALMLQGPIFDTLAIPVVDFQLAYDAMLGRTASVLAGTVEVKVEGWDAEIRHFVADFAKLAGPPVDVLSDADRGATTLSVTNVAESTLALSNPTFRARRGDASEEFSPSAALPPGTTLEPGATVTVPAILPDLPGAEPRTLSLASGMRVLPDDAAILDAILNRSTLEYFRDIEINAIPALFAAPAGRPQDQIHTILVEFEGGATVALNAEMTKVKARVDYPFDDVILRRVSHDGTYRYTRTIIRINGRQERDAEPQTSSASILFLSVTP